MRKITLIEGDGIGPEITEAVKTIFAAASVPIEWEEENAGESTLSAKGELIPASLIASIERNKVALKGPIATPIGEGFKSINVHLRQKFDLYQNMRPCASQPGLPTRFTDVDLVLFRENTEGLYSGLEFFDERLGISDSIARVTKSGCMKIVRAAFAYARKFNRKKVTLVHKANILKSAGKLFIDAGHSVAKDYPEIVFEDKIIDNMCMQLVIRPEQYDVIVTTNLFGDIISDLCAGLIGGLGVVAGANIGDDVAIYEAVHGTAPDIAGQNKANPTALLKSAILMLHHIGLQDHARTIENALNKTLSNPKMRTADLGGKAGTKEFAQNVIAYLE